MGTNYPFQSWNLSAYVWELFIFNFFLSFFSFFLFGTAIIYVLVLNFLILIFCFTFGKISSFITRFFCWIFIGC